MDNPILSAFQPLTRGQMQPAILDNFDPFAHRIAVKLDGRIVGEIVPEKTGYHETAYAYEYCGQNRGRDGVTPIGPAFDPAAMKRRIVAVMFNGDAEALVRAKLELVTKDAWEK
jgi:hypothetical protein